MCRNNRRSAGGAAAGAGGATSAKSSVGRPVASRRAAGVVARPRTPHQHPHTHTHARHAETPPPLRCFVSTPHPSRARARRVVLSGRAMAPSPTPPPGSALEKSSGAHAARDVVARGGARALARCGAHRCEHAALVERVGDLALAHLAQGDALHRVLLAVRSSDDLEHRAEGALPQSARGLEVAHRRRRRGARWGGHRDDARPAKSAELRGPCEIIKGWRWAG